MALTSFATNTIRVITGVFICLVILVLPTFVLLLIPSNTRKRLSTWLQSFTKGTIGLPPLLEAGISKPSSPTSPAMPDQPKTVADLQRIADQAAVFSQNLDIILRHSDGLQILWAISEYDRNFPIGCLGMYATLSLKIKHGLIGQPPNPVFTKERYMTECATVYDVLDVYYGAVSQEKRNETDNGPNGEGTRR